MYTHSSDSNSSLDALLQWLEESANPPSMQHASRIICMYVASVSFAIVDNIIVLVVIGQTFGRRSQISAYQINLALADLLMSVFCVPFTFAQAYVGFWAFGSFTCPAILFLQLCFVNVSAYTNVAIGIDRFLGVIFPFKWKPTVRQRKRILVLVWCFSALIASPEVVVGRSKEQYLWNGTQPLCNEYWRTPEQREMYTLAVFLLCLILPLVTLVITYSCVVYRLWIRQTPGNADIKRDRRRLSSKKKVTRMLIIKVAMFTLCWLPLHLFNLLVDFNSKLLNSADEHVVQTAFFACHWVAMSHAFVNPLIYFIADDYFRVR
ncbi:RYamide receptor-like [Haliotis asinina]|uniref:RYamide receptor-like n=1 Tax=Haliotis asinina TaxID=109174 RepID=UPI00353246EA